MALLARRTAAKDTVAADVAGSILAVAAEEDEKEEQEEKRSNFSILCSSPASHLGTSISPSPSQRAGCGCPGPVKP